MAWVFMKLRASRRDDETRRLLALVRRVASSSSVMKLGM